MAEPLQVDGDKLAEVALAIVSMTAFRDHDFTRVWKGLDWQLLDLLYQKGWIHDPKGKAKSVVLTDAGARLAQEFFRRHFGRKPFCGVAGFQEL